jgi:protein TonB
VLVGADGKVTDVTVVQDDGHGFGAAAQACARGLIFEPARDAEGRAVAGDRTLRVRFAR